MREAVSFQRTVRSHLLNGLVINILFKRLLGHVLQLQRVSVRSRGEVSKANPEGSAVGGPSGACSASLRRRGRWASLRTVQRETDPHQGLCARLCTGHPAAISLGTQSSRARGREFCPSSPAPAPGVRLWGARQPAALPRQVLPSKEGSVCCFTRAQGTFKGVGGSVVGLTQDSLARGVGTAVSGRFRVAADLLRGPGWQLRSPVQWFLMWPPNIFPLISFPGENSIRREP